MPRPSSKRQRKQKEKFSLAVKQHQRPIGADVDKVFELGEAGEEILDTNAVILPAKKGPKRPAEEEDAPEVKLSKSQRKKLRKLEEEKEKKNRRSSLLQSLAETALDSTKLKALRSVADKGQKETRKQRLARKKAMREAGLPISSDEEEEAAGEESDEFGFSSSEEDEEDAAALEARRKRLASRGPPVSLFPRRSEPEMGQPEGVPVAEPLPADLQEAVRQHRDELGVPEYRSDEEDDGPKPVKPSVPLENLRKPRAVTVARKPEIQGVREKLPILGMEQEIMELVAEHDVVVLSGETGCGKTTQVPQFLLEGGFGCARFPERSGAVGITQPRRIGAISTATRVAEELDSPLGKIVGYQVRHDKAVGENTALKFMTDGILLRELQHDFLLGRYSVILVDEAHERSLNTDILLGLLSRVVKLRRAMHTRKQTGPLGHPVWPLKLIIMSATLRVEDFLENKRLFPMAPPLITVPARQYPVTLHFSRRTEMHDYVKAAHRKVCQIHRMLPPGGILVFLTGQAEVHHLCRQLRTTFRPKKKDNAKIEDGKANAVDTRSEEFEDPKSDEANPLREEIELSEFGGDAAEMAGYEDYLSEDEVLEEDASDEEDRFEEEDVEVLAGAGFTPEQIAAAEAEFEERLGIRLPGSSGSAGDDDLQKANSDRKTIDTSSNNNGLVHVLPLYALLPSAAQEAVFQPPPPGSRLIVVATNVAETSLTIPGIRYVVDAGRAKQRVLESTSTGMARYEVGWISQASAAQRAGRAGRTGPGHCYRLYSSAVFNDSFPPHAAPEILGVPQESVVLALKSMGVARVRNFPFPTPPEEKALAAAITVLTLLGALEPKSEALTLAGKGMAALPINPRHARLILYAARCAVLAGSGLDREMPMTKKKKGPQRGVGNLKDATNLKQATQILAAAVALAAVLSVESPFLQIGDEVPKGDHQSDDEHADKETTGEEENVHKQEEGVREERQQRQAALRDDTSDALSALRALGGFLENERSAIWAASAGLHARHLEESVALRAQLSRLVSQNTAFQEALLAQVKSADPELISQILLAMDEHSISRLPKQTKQLTQVLRQAVLAGWPDRVARRQRSAEYLAAQAADAARSRRAIRYQAAMLDEAVFLHPASALHRNPPGVLVYTDLVRTTKRPYVSGVTSIDPDWLPEAAGALCHAGEPLPVPPPFYSPACDSVLAWHDVSFGRHGWALPRVARSHSALGTRCAAFAGALLEGKVLPSLADNVMGLLVSPEALSKPETQAQPRVSNLLFALERAAVDSKKSLLEVLRSRPGYLVPELRALYRPAFGDRVQAALRVKEENV